MGLPPGRSVCVLKDTRASPEPTVKTRTTAGHWLTGRPVGWEVSAGQGSDSEAKSPEGVWSTIWMCEFTGENAKPAARIGIEASRSGPAARGGCPQPCRQGWFSRRPAAPDRGFTAAEVCAQIFLEKRVDSPAAPPYFRAQSLGLDRSRVRRPWASHQSGIGGAAFLSFRPSVNRDLAGPCSSVGRARPW
jgi:hypothetical protein